MRWSVIGGAICAGAIIVVTAAIMSRRTSPPVEVQPGNSLTVASNRILAVDRGTKPRAREPVASTPALDPEAEAQKQINEIESAFVGGREDVATVVTAKLNHPDKRVRQSAVATLVKLDDTAAIPQLQRLLDLPIDPDEKTSIQEAIDYLSLPGYNDLVAAGELPRLEMIPPEAATNSAATAVPNAFREVLSSQGTNR